MEALLPGLVTAARLGRLASRPNFYSRGILQISVRDRCDPRFKLPQSR